MVTLAVPRTDWGRVVSRALIGVLLFALAVEVYTRFIAPGSLGVLGMDYRTYLDATRSWLGGGPFYHPYQVAGPYTVETGAVLYPPVALLLFVPFAFLPAALWFVIPAAIMAAVVWHHRPSIWGWVIILACLAFSPLAQTAYWFGTPTIWMAAFLALGTVYGWPGVLLALKPAIFPFMLAGIRDRRWWIAGVALALVSLPMLPMWFDWVRVVLNARGHDAGLFYALGDMPLLAIPLVAWSGHATLSK